MSWILVQTTTDPWPMGEARYDGTFDDYDTCRNAFIADMKALGIHAWRASSPADIGVFRRVWWSGPIDTGGLVAEWLPYGATPSGDVRQVMLVQLCGDFFRTGYRP